MTEFWCTAILIFYKLVFPGVFFFFCLVFLKLWADKQFSFGACHWLCSKMPYYHTISAVSVCTFSVCMKYPDDLLYLTESVIKYTEMITEAVFRMVYYHTTPTILQYAVWILWIVCEFFCMHGMPGLHATSAVIWCMHLKVLRGILFPRTQGAPCDVLSSNVWVNWRRGIVIINCKTCICTYKLQTIAVHLKTISLVWHKLYFNLYGTFPIQSNDVTLISITLYSSQYLKWIKKVNQSCPKMRTNFSFRTTLMKGFDPLQMLTTEHCFKDI